MKQFKWTLATSMILIFSSLPASTLPRFVTPDARDIRCTKDSDCIQISSSCDGCCQNAAIHKSSEIKFSEKVKQCQADWMNQATPIVCDCSPVKSFVRCVKNKCHLEMDLNLGKVER